MAMRTESCVKLLGVWMSPFVLRVRIVLNIKSVPYDFIEESLASKSDLLFQSNPIYKKVPVLIDANKPICESLIIVQYIDEVWTSGPSLLPCDPYDRAIARFWAAYTDDKLLLSGLSSAQGEKAKEKAFEQMVSALGSLEEAFWTCSKGKGFFGGEQIGYLDIALGSYLGWFRVIEKMNCFKLLDEAKTPGLVAWAERFCAHDAVTEVMPETEKLMEFAKKLQANFNAPPPN